MTQSFDEVFQQLQPIYGSYMQHYPTSFDCVIDRSDEYYLNTLHIISVDLKRRMQGKSCFNFKKIEADLFTELTELVKSGFSAYHNVGYIK